MHNVHNKRGICRGEGAKRGAVRETPQELHRELSPRSFVQSLMRKITLLLFAALLGAGESKIDLRDLAKGNPEIKNKMADIISAIFRRKVNCQVNVYCKTEISAIARKLFLI